MSNIPTQQNLIEIIQNIDKNDVITLIKNITSIINYAEKIDIKQLQKNDKNMIIIQSSLLNYFNNMSKIMDIISTKFNGANLNEILGYEKEIRNNKNEIVTKSKYTVLEAIIQISNLLESISKSLTSLSSFSISLFKNIKLKANIKLITYYIQDLINTLFDEFSSINNESSNLISLLVTDPETITEINNIQDNSETSKVITKKGKMGLLDIIANFLSLINNITTLKFPNLIVFKTQMIFMEKILNDILSSILNLAVLYTNEGYIKTLNKFSAKSGFLGVADKKNNKGILGFINSIQTIIKTICSIQATQLISGYISLNIMFKIFEELISNVNNILNINISNFKNIDVFSKNLILLNKLIKEITSFTKNISLLGIVGNLLIILYPSIWLSLKIYIAIFKQFSILINIINNINIEKDIKEMDKNINNFNKIILKLILIGFSIIALAAISIPLTIAIIPAMITLGIIWGFSKLANFVLKSIGNPANVAMTTLYILGASLVFTLVTGVILLISHLLLDIIVASETILPNIGNIMLLILGIAGISVVVGVLGAICISVAPILILSLLGFGLLSGTILMIHKLAIDLMTLQEIGEKLDEEKINNSVTTVINTAKNITTSLMGGMNIIDKFKQIGDARKSKRYLKAIRKSIYSINIIAQELVKLSKISFNEDQQKNITDNVKLIIATADKVIITLFKKLDNKERRDKVKAARQSKRFLSPITDSTAMLNEIAEQLKHLQNYNKENPLDETLIDDNITLIIDTANSLITSIFSTGIENENMRQHIREARKTKRFLSPITDSTSMLNDIAENLNKIQEYSDKLNQDVIQGNIDKIIEIANDTIKDIFGAIEGVTNTRKAMRQKVREANKSEDFLEPVSSSIGLIGGIAENLKKINETVTFTEDDKKNIQDKITNIIKTTNSSIGSLASNNDFMKNIKSLNDSSSSLFTGFDSFVESTNKLDINKLKSANTLFESMSKFAKDFNGQFDKLAEALSDKIAPVLEDLKEMLGEIPEKIDNNASSVSSSIYANSSNKPSTSTAMAAQVQRESGNSMSAEEVNNIVENRMKNAALEKSRSVETKLDELLDLLRSGTVQIKVGL